MRCALMQRHNKTIHEDQRRSASAISAGVTLAAAAPRLSAEPLYFPSRGRGLFGWLHRPIRPVTSGMGLVICKPFGNEALCSHRSVRVLAETVAELGIPALRFDYAGTGDSADLEQSADQIDAWVADIVAAIGELQRRTGVERVCLLGFRLGAALAALAAAQCGQIGGLVLCAPVVSGPRYLRELRTTRLASLISADDTSGDATTAQKSTIAAEDSLEVTGHALSAASVAALAEIDLTELSFPPDSRVLIIDRDDLPTARQWSDGLVRAGVRADYLALPGFLKMLMIAPLFAVVPQAVVVTASQWLLGIEERPGVTPQPRDGTAPAGAHPPALALPGESGSGDALVLERPVTFGEDVELFGIATEPQRDEAHRRAVILLTSGADQHIGVGRMHVSLARSWGRRGFNVLRMDLAGIGDSGTRAGRPCNEVFPPRALEDIARAIDFMRTSYGISDVTLAGLCSGAYHALRAAVANLPVSRILMLNPENFFWKEGSTLEELRLVDVVRNPGLYRHRVFSRAAWRRLLTGQVDIWRVLKIYFYRPLLTVESKLRDLARWLRLPLPNDLGWELEHIGARALRIVFVFARGEPGIDLLRIQAGSSIRRLGERCRVHIVDSAGHTFSRRRSRVALERILCDELLARHTRPAVATGVGSAADSCVSDELGPARRS